MRSVEENSSVEARRLLEFESRRDKLLSADKYIARSDYRSLVEDFTDFYQQIKALQNSDVLTEFCSKRHIEENRLRSFLDLYDELKNEQVGSDTIKSHNDDLWQHI